MASSEPASCSSQNESTGTDCSIAVVEMTAETLEANAIRTGTCLDRVCAKVFTQWLPSKNSARKAIKRGEVLVDREIVPASQAVRLGQTLALLPNTQAQHPIWELALDILFEDEHMAVVVKPAGIPTNGNRHRSFEHALPGALQPTSEPGALSYPRPCHRLDVATSGLMLVAKTGQALARIGEQFEQRRIEKTYRAIVSGWLEGSGIITQPIEGRDAVTEWKVLQQTPCLKTEQITTLELHPKTGRTHQLRIHLAELGHPIVGDTLYTGDRPLHRSKGLFLQALAVEFDHPVTTERMRVEMDEAKKFEAFRTRETRRWKRHSS